MTDKESLRAAREARESAQDRVSPSHGTAELAERNIRRYLAAEQRRSQEKPGGETEDESVGR
ncbi:hypothetical protein FPZ12_017885 [Amycolatopsis acidicola]|uniref:Uncharacterized protein n=1 Tax=Amycolatopsis acidicola TaxID=2596893 RepID=A0A5N0V519_9PSEU|nr:hypothetical protein [Amycolatopsis acidicola]KAA9160220.1 hypothetical protein FPZ12_017885 [Amycolatopsis acidicola]